MTKKNIYIFSGAIGSGKTTALVNWSAARKDVHGILTPRVMNKRVFMDAKSREQFAMEAFTEDRTILKVGHFIFSYDAFLKASNIIRDAIEKRNWLIIDEIGPLELRNEGFATVLNEVIHSSNNEQNILLVVREGLSQEVKNAFEINNAVVITDINKIQG